MRRQSYFVLVLGFGLLIAPASGPAQEKGTKKDDKTAETPSKKTDKIADGLLGRVFQLVPPPMLNELKLTEEQRREVLKLEGSYKAKKMETMVGAISRVMAIIDSFDDDGDTKEVAPVLALAHEITGGLLDARRLRFAYEKKILALLNPEQQMRFAQFKDRPVFGDGTTTFRFYPPHDPERLQLTEQQKQRLNDLHREMEAKFRELLTEQQRKLLDESKSPSKTPKDK